MLSEYGKILRIIRINNGELLNDMAQKVDVSPALLSYIENGKREIPVSCLINLSRLYNVSIDYLVESDKIKKITKNKNDQ